MQIKQWEDKNLSHFSYGVLSDCSKQIVLVDPARDVQPYLDWAKEQQATIVAIIETHPHADFASGHAELRQLTGATIYTHSLVGVKYQHKTFDDGESFEIGNLKFTSLHTPGHSPDSISILLEHHGMQKAVFTGDTLFIGDCGRPDLREGVGNIQTTRKELAVMMYHSLRNKLMHLNDDVVVYPAHGAGSLCGKNLSKENSSTIAKEKQTNWCLQEATEEEFVGNLLADQPFIPLYFAHDVDLNRAGAPAMTDAISGIEIKEFDSSHNLDSTLWVVDARDEKSFKAGHLPHSMNLMENGKFETWLGSIIKPGESFYLVGDSRNQLQRLLKRIGAIGYEKQVKEAFVVEDAPIEQEPIDLEHFKQNPDDYTIVDVRNHTEVKQGKPFAGSLSIPLPEIRNRVGEIPTNKPIVVHCAAGYRSAAASSIIAASLNGNARVLDLSDAIKDFK